MTGCLVYIPKNLSLGGLRQLLVLLSLSQNSNNRITVYAQRNLKDQLSGDYDFIVASSIRIFNEIKIKRLSRLFDQLICFSNLPTLFGSVCEQIVFIQDRHLVEEKIIKGLSLKLFFKTLVKRTVLKYFVRQSKLLVQTVTMAFHLHNMGFSYSQIYLLPELSKKFRISDGEHEIIRKVFFYPTSTAAHKNNKVLFEAWKLLEDAQITVDLVVTLRKSEIDRQLPSFSDNLSNVKFVGPLSETEVAKRIEMAHYLIYPSLFESFGFSLFDAVNVNTPIISSESSYVYDMCTPKMTFDPKCVLSMARTVARAVGQEESFLNHIFRDVSELTL